MLVYRIAKAPHARDLSGTGARVHGGRWNGKGTAVLYTSTSPALATVEFLVHVDPVLLPTDLRLVAIEIPDSASLETVDAASLPEGWNTYPGPAELAEIGTGWVASGRSVALRVPSAVVPGDGNVLLNPDHPDFAGVRVVEDRAVSIDPRLAPTRQSKTPQPGG